MYHHFISREWWINIYLFDSIGSKYLPLCSCFIYFCTICFMLARWFWAVLLWLTYYSHKIQSLFQHFCRIYDKIWSLYTPGRLVSSVKWSLLLPFSFSLGAAAWILPHYYFIRRPISWPGSLHGRRVAAQTHSVHLIPPLAPVFIWLRHDSTESNECFKYSSWATRVLYTPASCTDDPRLRFQLFQVETTSRFWRGLRAPQLWAATMSHCGLISLSLSDLKGV